MSTSLLGMSACAGKLLGREEVVELWLDGLFFFTPVCSESRPSQSRAQGRGFR